MHTSVQRALELPNHKQKSNEWFAKRKECKLTASEFPSALGRGYKSRFNLLKIKAGLAKNSYYSKFTSHGEKWEDHVREEYAKRHSVKIYEFGCATHAELNPNGITYLGGSPDGITEDGTLIEIKCPYTRIPDGKVPRCYVDQIQGLMWIFNLDKAVYIDFMPADPDYNKKEVWVEVQVPRDPKWAEENVPLLQKFCEDVDSKKRGVCHKMQSVLPSFVQKHEGSDSLRGLP